MPSVRDGYSSGEDGSDDYRRDSDVSGVSSHDYVGPVSGFSVSLS